VLGQLGAQPRRDHANLLGAGDVELVGEGFLIEPRSVARHRSPDDQRKQRALLRRQQTGFGDALEFAVNLIIRRLHGHGRSVRSVETTERVTSSDWPQLNG
jgi:hypothetical protein